MKHRNLFTTLAVALALVCGLTIGASAAGTLQEIKAYLSTEITVKYNGETQALKAADGSTIYPITYNGTTYLPVRAIGNIFGVDVKWDQATKTVLLGEAADGVDLIENFEPYTPFLRKYTYTSSTAVQFLQSKDKQVMSIGGESVSHWLGTYYNYHEEPKLCSFNLGGKYSSLSFKAYSEADITLYVKGDNGSVLGQFDLKGGQVPQTFNVNLLNTTQLTFEYEKIPTVEYPRLTYPNSFIFNTILK
ncbi:MAG: hypothetical protein K2O18_02450 [Oscillospiraceae bacterium]|nr:hypothetical protein [Oscillospiraceae bacterium]